MNVNVHYGCSIKRSRSAVQSDRVDPSRSIPCARTCEQRKCVVTCVLHRRLGRRTVLSYVHKVMWARQESLKQPVRLYNSRDVNNGVAKRPEVRYCTEESHRALLSSLIVATALLNGLA